MVMVGADERGAENFRLEPEKGIDLAGGSTVALSADAWLKIVPISALAGLRWVRLRYSLSFFDDPVRPMIRFITSEGRQFLQQMNGPVVGSGEWVGRIPDKAISVSISPIKCPGRFEFRLDRVRRVSRPSLVRRGILYDRKSLMLSVGAKIINADEERWETLKFASSATPLDEYDQWYRQRERAIELDGLDRPRVNWRSSPRIRVIIGLNSNSAERLKATISSLRAQIYRNWSLYAIRISETPSALHAAFREEMAIDPRLSEIASGEDLSSLAADAEDCVAIIEAGDLIPSHAFAVLGEAVARFPKVRVVYGDEDSMAADGRLHSPVFKPDWSPIFFNALPYLGRLSCIRYLDLQKCAGTAGEFIRDENEVLKRAIAFARADEILHVRRILYRRQREANDEIYSGGRAFARPSSREANGSEPLPGVTIIVPTRDRADLLARCMKSLREVTDYPSFDVVIVDNGSTEPDAKALLEQLRSQPRIKVLSRPGKFNFSALCNDGARLAKKSVLVFLNNDIVIFDPVWLRALVHWAQRPEIGVVGAKLLFPNNTIEHAGVVLGHGGIAGHIYPGQAASEPGRLHELTVPHEVTAVTGACLAVQRKKFKAVGGFDSAHLPVDLNDIDLCLKIAERGWKVIWTPESVLYHIQSASRGFPIKPFKLYKKERDYFRRRWSQIIRDDPFFHPALSLYSHKPALA